MNVRQCIAGILSCVTALCAANLAAQETEERPVTQFVQSWLGGVNADGAWTLVDPDTGDALSGDFSTLPLAAGAGQRVWGARVQWGFEGGGLVSWKNDRVALFGTSNSAELQIDNSFFMVETFFGGLLSIQATQWMRIYFAAGPSIAWSFLDDEDDNDDRFAAAGNTGSGLFLSLNGGRNDGSFSGYARAGIDFEFSNGFAVGTSARYFDHRFEFGSRGALDIDHVQWFLTFTQRL